MYASIHINETNKTRQLTCRSPGKNVLQIAYPHSIVRIHATVFKFHIFNEPGRWIRGYKQEKKHSLRIPLEAEAKIWSSELMHKVRTSVL